MKKALLGMALVFGLGLAGISDAQAQGITLGAQGGYNYSQISDIPTGIDEIGDKGGLIVGAFVDIQFHKLIFVSVEGNYVERKAELTETGVTGDFKQNYIDIPALLGVRLMSGMLQPVLYAGGMVSFETKCTLSTDLLSESCANLDFGTESNVWSAVFGGGLDIALSVVRLNADIRYNLGLSGVVEDEDAKWNSWMALVGIGFGLGG
jgi:hypothetical protein